MEILSVAGLIASKRETNEKFQKYGVAVIPFWWIMLSFSFWGCFTQRMRNAFPCWDHRNTSEGTEFKGIDKYLQTPQPSFLRDIMPLISTASFFFPLVLLPSAWKAILGCLDLYYPDGLLSNWQASSSGQQLFFFFFSWEIGFYPELRARVKHIKCSGKIILKIPESYSCCNLHKERKFKNFTEYHKLNEGLSQTIKAAAKLLKFLFLNFTPCQKFSQERNHLWCTNFGEMASVPH